MFKLVTDNTADLPVSYLQEHNVGCMPISYILDGVTYGKDRELDWKDFYQMIREGKLPTTSQINPSEAKEFFEEFIKTDKEILYLAFTSGMSGTCNNIRLAAEEIMEENTEQDAVDNIDDMNPASNGSDDNFFSEDDGVQLTLFE